MEDAGIYDYVVVGGGTAGLVVAARLSEDPQISVLVLEAGQDRLLDPRVSIPGMAMASQRDPELSYPFRTVPQEHLNGRVIAEPQGKMLGGSSGINNQAFIAPSTQDIDAWAELGNPGWDWKTLSPYYRKVFTRTVPEKEVRTMYGMDYLSRDELQAQGSSGPLQVSYSSTLGDPLGKAWIESFEHLKLIDSKTDPFDGQKLGAYASPSSVDGLKKRSYAHSSYLLPAQGRSNLTVQTGSLAERIVFKNRTGAEDLVAEHVIFILDGKQQSVRVRKDVVLAAGAFQTPKLLELSGIGDPSILTKCGIDVLVSNPNVGSNLQYHLMTGISFEVRPGIETLDDVLRQVPEALQKAATDYENKRGVLTVGGVASYATVPLATTEIPGQANLLQHLNSVTFDNADQESLESVRKIMRNPQFGTGAYWIAPAQWPVNGQVQLGSYVTLGTNQCYVFSRGNVHIRSKDILEDPVIDPRYLSENIDMEILARQVYWLRTLSRCPPFQAVFKTDGRVNHELAQFDDLEGAKEYVRHTATTEGHPCGACAMLPQSDGGVVSPSLLVYGTQNVRIVDSSIMPLITSSNLQSTVYAVAEYAADIIRFGAAQDY